MNHVTVIGAGLAGSECAWQLAQRGISVTLREIAERPDVDKLFGDVRFEKENRALFEGMLSGRRFREKEWETQFSAITFILDDGTLFLAFRGTDETIIGWKEDFNMAFLSPVPGQEYSVKYVNMVTGWLHQPAMAVTSG